MHELAEREDVIALALHVDYWDYIGWKDPFAHPAHAKRQRAYAAEGNRRSIYTPEMVVNGVTDIVGAKPMALSKAISDHTRQAPQASLSLTRSGDMLHVSAQLLVKLPGPFTLHMVRYSPSQETMIERGENAGHTFTYANVVQAWEAVTEWDGQGDLELDIHVAGQAPAVLILQQRTAGPILAAARLR